MDVSANAVESQPAIVSSTRLNRGDLVIVLLLLLATLGLYSRVRNAEYIGYDDPLYVTQNQHVLNGWGAGSLNYVMMAVVSANWHPLTVAAAMTVVQFFGSSSFTFHVYCALLHAANVALLYLFFRTATRWKSPAVAVAVLWGWHPLRVESAAQRKGSRWLWLTNPENLSSEEQKELKRLKKKSRPWRNWRTIARRCGKSSKTNKSPPPRKASRSSNNGASRGNNWICMRSTNSTRRCTTGWTKCQLFCEPLKQRPNTRIQPRLACHPMTCLRHAKLHPFSASSAAPVWMTSIHKNQRLWRKTPKTALRAVPERA